MELVSDGQLKKLIEKRQKRDAKMIIRMIMESPLKEGEVVMPDGQMSIAELSQKNLDVQTRIILTMAGQAASGDSKSAEFLFKYGGYTPPVEQNVTVNLPRIVNDIEFKQEEMLEEAEYEILDKPEEKENEDDGKRCETI